MSLLEDIFLRDEANEAQELERIIEGEEFEERARSDSDSNSEKEDEAEEDKRRVDPNTTKTKRAVRNPRFVLNPARLTGPRGIQVIPEHFKDFKFAGKGHEKEDLDLILKKLEHWAYRLYPKFKFEDCLKKIETLGKKRPVMVHLQKIRSGQLMSDETVVQKDSSDEGTPAAEPEEDEFDRLLQQQIELARATPAPNSAKKPQAHSPIENRLLTIPKATSSPSISDEQRERMLRSRRLAEEKRLARLKNISTESVETTLSVNQTEASNETEPFNNVGATNKDGIEIDETEVGRKRRHNKSNVIDSSDEEDEAVTCVNESITVDIHSNNTNNHEDESQKDHVQEQQGENLVNADAMNDIEVEQDIETDRIVSNKTNSITEDPKEESSDLNIEKENIMVTEENANVNEKSQEIEDTNTFNDVETKENDSSKLILQGTNEILKDNLDQSKTDNNVGKTNIEEVNSKKKDQDSTEIEIMDVDFSEEF